VKHIHKWEVGKWFDLITMEKISKHLETWWNDNSIKYSQILDKKHNLQKTKIHSAQYCLGKLN